LSKLITPNITNNFQFVIVKHTHLSDSAVSITQPGISVAPYEKMYINALIKMPPRNQDYTRDDLNVIFNLNEDYSNYFEFFNWIHSYNESGSQESMMSDIEVYHYDMNKNPIRKIVYSDCFPTGLSSIDLTTQTSEAEPLKFTVQFAVNKISVVT